MTGSHGLLSSSEPTILISATTPNSRGRILWNFGPVTESHASLRSPGIQTGNQVNPKPTLAFCCGGDDFEGGGFAGLEKSGGNAEGENAVAVFGAVFHDGVAHLD